MKIALFDDHQVVLDALSAFLHTKPDVELVGSAKTRPELLRLLQAQEVDVLISDVITDEEIGLELFEEVQALNLPLKIIVYSSITSQFVQDFLKAYGVVAFLNKRESLDALWETLELIMMATRYKKAPEAPDFLPPTLTPREKDIARYLAKGLSAKEIALLLGSSVNTVNNQKNTLMLKFGCANSVELTLKLTQMGYLRI